MGLKNKRISKANKLFKQPVSRFEPIDLSSQSFIPKGMTKAYKNNRFVVMVY